jgi:hypothetical protein
MISQSAITPKDSTFITGYDPNKTASLISNQKFTAMFPLKNIFSTIKLPATESNINSKLLSKMKNESIFLKTYGTRKQKESNYSNNLKTIKKRDKVPIRRFNSVDEKHE